VLEAGISQCEKSSFPYLFGIDNTVLMVEVILRVELEDGRSWDFDHTETASFQKGTRRTWTVVEPVLHFFLQTDSREA